MLNVLLLCGSVFFFCWIKRTYKCRREIKCVYQFEIIFTINPPPCFLWAVSWDMIYLNVHCELLLFVWLETTQFSNGWTNAYIHRNDVSERQWLDLWYECITSLITQMFKIQGLEKILLLIDFIVKYNIDLEENYKICIKSWKSSWY